MATLLSLRSTQAANPCINVKINEFEPNPSGTDPSIINVEILCAASDKGNGISFSEWLVSIGSDSGASPGTVNRTAQISGTFDSSGILLVSIPDLENPSFTFLLMEDFTGSVGGTDIDTDMTVWWMTLAHLSIFMMPLESPILQVLMSLCMEASWEE
jgi:hypothetical protein